MKIVVIDEGREVFSYDTDKTSSSVCPSVGDAPAVIEALDEAEAFLEDWRPPAA